MDTWQYWENRESEWITSIHGCWSDDDFSYKTRRRLKGESKLERCEDKIRILSKARLANEFDGFVGEHDDFEIDINDVFNDSLIEDEAFDELKA